MRKVHNELIVIVYGAPAQVLSGCFHSMSTQRHTHDMLPSSCCRLVVHPLEYTNTNTSTIHDKFVMHSMSVWMCVCVFDSLCGCVVVVVAVFVFHAFVLRLRRLCGGPTCPFAGCERNPLRASISASKSHDAINNAQYALLGACRASPC